MSAREVALGVGAGVANLRARSALPEPPAGPEWPEVFLWVWWRCGHCGYEQSHTRVRVTGDSMLAMQDHQYCSNCQPDDGRVPTYPRLPGEVHMRTALRTDFVKD